MANWYLDSLEITGGFLAGLSLRLPRGLICVIGPRGSGKSTLAEAVRYVFGGGSNGPKTIKDLVQANLSDAIVTVRTAPGSDGTSYVVRRNVRQPPVLALPDGTPVQGIELERGTFLPVDVYSSNEIEGIAEQSLGDRRRSLLDDLRASELLEVQQTLGNHRRALDANRDSIRATRSQVASLGEQIEEFAEAPAKLLDLPPAASDDGHAELMHATRRQQTNERENEALSRAEKGIADMRADVVRLAEVIASSANLSLVYEESVNAPILVDAESAIRDVARDTAGPFALARDAIERAIASLAEVHERLRVAHAAHRTEFAQLTDRNLVASRVVQARTAAERAVTRLGELKTQRATAQQSLTTMTNDRKELRGAYLLAREQISQLRDDVARELQREAGEKVRVRVLRNADTLAYQQFLTAGLQGARVKNHEQILGNMLRLRPEALAQVLQEDDFAEFERQTALTGERGRKIFDAFREKLDPMELELVPTEDQVSIELNVGTAAEPNFKEASALSRGQKCTALLPLLLARRDAPLIVDQPEDNLDNHFIYETVVDTIQRLKHRRQMVFVTHNANIPVLAEADLVVVMDSDGRSGFVRKTGSLDSCRDEIIDLLEGGREAFELRRKRYG